MAHKHNHKKPEGKIYQNIKTETLENSEVSISGEITTEGLDFYKKEAIEHFKEEVSLPGFRKGHVPENILLEKVGELSILEEAGEMALKSCFPEILAESGIDSIGMPEVSITKLAPGNPMGFKIKTAVFPKFTLPEYKKISKEINAKKEVATVTEKEIEEAITTIRRMKQNLPEKPEEGKDEEPLKDLTDDLVKEWGKFEGVSDFKQKITDSLKNEKDFRAKEKNRLEIIKSVVEKTEIPVPRVMLEMELDRMTAQMKDDISRIGITFDEYLKRINKKEEDLRKEWEKDATDRVKMELILGKIADEEKIDAPDEEVEKEVKHLSEHYVDADPIKASGYFRHVIRNEKVFQFLEGQ